ncbi:ABC transporter ATP-binding protein [Desulfobacca acetoxidans]|uniref:Xenobiotic-transporting ATPase n=1 Tax=Desulfobacca acetoxidans (strain ATCC 700848 / DSM 11109 / ASRB2) TaxID=880072 RepID=F2NGC8_DESAR|nr:ABC transporter ATP-binding protein [Desulfobacca acetoxidans]AEB08541.1 Xenobiotic-transporting ATPase [Desulfobacca acetoxidans DSM 11109]
MNLIALINAATMGQPRRVRPLIIWTVLEYFLRGAPYGILLLVVWEIFNPLEHPGTPLNVTRVTWFCVALLASLIILYLVSRKAYFAAYKSSYEICADGRLAIVEHLRRLPMGFYNSRDPGDIGAYIVSDYASVEQIFSHYLPQFCGALAAPTALLAGLAFINWKLALAAALVIPLSLPLTWISVKIITYLGKKHQKLRVDSASRMIEYIQGIRLIKAFNLRGVKFERLEKTFRRLKSISIRLEAGAGPTMILGSFVLHAGLTLIILYGFSLILAGELAIPVYVMFLVLGARLYEPLLFAHIFFGEMNYFKLGVERLEDLRLTPPLPDGNAGGSLEGREIEFKNVTFSYHDAPILKRLNLKIPAGSLTALVGPSGGGKTTLTRLIARFWDVDQGEIRIGGKNLRSYRTDDLLANISVVFQDVYLFNDTIYNNIRLGRPDAGREEIIAAARAARCHDFIERLPDRYDTMVGEGGSTLSGGEKQRVSIARALLKDAPIVLLDEATAFLDPENEVFIQEAINDLVRNKTVVVIAHRLNTITGADKIVVVDQGKVVEEGRHDELLAGNGLYAALWREQQRLKEWKFGDVPALSPA